MLEVGIMKSTYFRRPVEGPTVGIKENEGADRVGGEWHCELAIARQAWLK